MSDFSAAVAIRTIWGEARGEGEAGMRAVAHVLINRQNLGRWGKTLAEVCLAPFQFSCWNTSDPNRRQMAALADRDPLLIAIAHYLLDAHGDEPDPTGGATHYYAIGSPIPAWAAGAHMLCQIGRHVFFRVP